MHTEAERQKKLDWEIGNTIAEDRCRAPYDGYFACARQFKHDDDHAFGYGNGRVEWPVIYCDAVRADGQKCQLWGNHLDDHITMGPDGKLQAWPKDVSDGEALQAWIRQSSK